MYKRQLISILVLAFYLSAINNFLGTIYQAYMRTKPLLVATVVGAAACLAFTAILVHDWGISAAAFGVFVGSLVIFVVRVIDVRRLMAINMRPIPTAITMMLLTVQSLVTSNQCKMCIRDRYESGQNNTRILISHLLNMLVILVGVGSASSDDKLFVRIQLAERLDKVMHAFLGNNTPEKQYIVILMKTIFFGNFLCLSLIHI